MSRVGEDVKSNGDGGRRVRLSSTSVLMTVDETIRTYLSIFFSVLEGDLNERNRNLYRREEIWGCVYECICVFFMSKKN